MDTEYCVYKMTLGPTTDGEYLQMTCQRIQSLAKEFIKYQLDEVNRELRGTVIVLRNVSFNPILLGA